MKLEDKKNIKLSLSKSLFFRGGQKRLAHAVVLFSILLSLLMCLALPEKIAAIVVSDTNKRGPAAIPPIEEYPEGEIRLTFQIEQGEEAYKEPVTGVPVRLYRVGQLQKTSEEAPLTSAWLTSYQSLPDAPFSLGEPSEREQAQIKELRRYIKANKIQPDAEGSSNHQGEVSWTGLASGVYLVSYAKGENIEAGDYVFQDFYINLPTLAKDETGPYYWQTSILAKPKMDRVEPTQPSEPSSSSTPSLPQVTETKPSSENVTGTGEGSYPGILLGALCLGVGLSVLFWRLKQIKAKNQNR